MLETAAEAGERKQIDSIPITGVSFSSSMLATTVTGPTIYHDNTERKPDEGQQIERAGGC